MYIVRLKYFFLFVFWLSIYQIKIFIYCTCQSYIVSYFFSWHSFFFFLLFLYRFTFYRAWCCQRCWRSTSSVSGVECHRAVFERVRLFLICSLWFPVLVFFFWWVTHFFILLLLPTPSSFFSTITFFLYHLPSSSLPSSTTTVTRRVLFKGNVFKHLPTQDVHIQEFMH